MPYIGRGPAKSGAFRILDDISGSFNGVLTSFALSSGSASLTVGLPQTLTIAVDGVVQEPGTAYTISGSNIVFGAAPQADATFWGVELGDVGGIAQQAVTQSASDDSTSIATTAYVDNQIDVQLTAEDLDVTGDSGTIAIDLDSEALAITGGTGITTTASGNAVNIVGHADAHTVVSHSDTTGTGPELDELTDGSTTTLHVHAARKLDDLATPDDNTDLNVSTSRHGLVPKITSTSNFLKGDGTWAAVASSATDISDQANTSTGYFDAPSGTTAQRPGSPATGMIRFNTTLTAFEYYNGTHWFKLVGDNTTATSTVDYLVVAGGGGAAGTGGAPTSGAGGGGAGGFRTTTGFAVASGSAITVTVGAGGSAGASTALGSAGQDSVFSTITADGGGAGGGTSVSSTQNDGGSGGGGGGGGGSGSGGVATAGQGNAGGDGSASNDEGGGGGGAGAAGTAGTAGSARGNGGIGEDEVMGMNASASNTFLTAISAGHNSGGARYFSGGGGGGGNNTSSGGTGGLGGGGTSPPSTQGSGVAGTANTGGGGSGGFAVSSNMAGGAGGSGIVIIRYLDSFPAASATTGSPTIVVSGGHRIYKWTQSGSITI